MTESQAYSLQISRLRAWVLLLWTLMATIAAIVGGIAVADLLNPSDSRTPVQVAAVLWTAPVLLAGTWFGMRSIVNRTTVRRGDGYEQPFRVTATLGDTGGAMAVAAIVTAATAGLALAYYVPWLFHQVARGAEAQPGTRPAADTGEPPPAVSRIESRRTPKALLPRAIAAAALAGGGLVLVYLAAAEDLAHFEELGATEATGDGDLPGFDPLLWLGAGAACVSFSALVTVRWLFVAVIDRIGLRLEDGSTAELEVRTGTGRAIAHYAGMSLAMLLSIGSFGAFLAVFVPHVLMHALRNTRAAARAGTPDE